MELDAQDTSSATVARLSARGVRAICWLIALAHQRGLAVGLKNSTELLDAVADQIDFCDE